MLCVSVVVEHIMYKYKQAPTCLCTPLPEAKKHTGGNRARASARARARKPDQASCIALSQFRTESVQKRS